MKDYPITVTYQPTQSRFKPGGPVLVRVEIKNETNSEVEVLAAGIPWFFHHAVRFSVSAGAKEGASFKHRLWILEPPSTPDIIIGPGKSISGEVDLAQYLYTDDGRSISEVSGEYSIRAHLSTFVSVIETGEETQTLHIDSEPFTILIGD
jgi:hypothetical protein